MFLMDSVELRNICTFLCAIRFLLVIEYVRIGRRIPSTKPLTERYSVGFSSGCIMDSICVYATSFTIHFMGNRLDYRFHNTIFGWTVSHQVRTSYIPFTRADGTLCYYYALGNQFWE